MQTFLPYPCFKQSVQCLDNKRLGKQRVEALQILKALRGDYAKTGAWENQPATRMWRGYSLALSHYMNICIEEWIERGFKNTMEKVTIDEEVMVMPPWLGDERIHASHRSNLLKKEISHYEKFKWKEKNDIPYFWIV